MNSRNNTSYSPTDQRNISYNLSHHIVVLLLFIQFVFALFLILRYNILLPFSYIFLFVLIYLMIYIAYKYTMTTIYPLIVVLYSICIVSVFAFRFGLFQGDSQLDLASTQYILRHHFIKSINSYEYSIFPIIHILTASIGYSIGKSTFIDIYDVAVWIPTICAIISSIFIYLSVKLLTRESKYGLLSSIIWISLSFVSRWMIQFTRTTMAILLLNILTYLLIKEFEYINARVSYSILNLIVVFTLILSHPVVSFFGIFSLLFVTTYELLRVHFGAKFASYVDHKSYAFQINNFVVVSLVFLLFYWIYMAYMARPFCNTVSEFSISLSQLLRKSIFGQILTNTSSNSYSIASTNLKLLGLCRVTIFFLTSSVGLLFQLFDKKLKFISIPLSIFGLVFLVFNYGFGAASTTFYRTAVYSSIWLIFTLGYFLHKVDIIKTKKVKYLIHSILLIFLVLPAPFFTGEVVLPSDWIYSENPYNHIDYKAGEAQRFLEHYHIDVPIWINKYTNENSLVWSDGAYTYAAIIGYGDRDATYSPAPLINSKIDISKFKSLNCDYVVVNALMRKDLYIPYGAPPFYSNYNFSELELNNSSYKIYDSKDADVYKI